MSDPTSQPPTLDLSTVNDPDVRRALRKVYQELCDTMQRQDLEIQALLGMMLEKHVGSLGEYKRHLLKLQQGGARSARIQGQISSTLQAH